MSKEVVCFNFAELWLLLTWFRRLVSLLWNPVDANFAWSWLCKLLVRFNLLLLLLSTSSFIGTFLSNYLSTFRANRLVKVAPSPIMTRVKRGCAWTLMQVVYKLPLLAFIGSRCLPELVVRLSCSWTSAPFPLFIFKISARVVLSMQ